MKIKYLHIRNYKQFLDLELDLTYPKGHEKEGEPLDKICIVGQSGTGKTNLLEVIKKSTFDFSSQESYLPFNEFVGKDTDDRYITSKFLTKDGVLAETLFTLNKSKINFITNNPSMSGNQFLKPIQNMTNSEKIYYVGTNKCIDTNKSINYIPQKMTKTDESILNDYKRQRNHITNLGSDYYGEKEFREKLIDIDKKIEQLEQKYIISKDINNLKSKNFLKNNIIDINKNIDSVWSIMKEKIVTYEKELLKIKDKLSNKLLNDENYHKENFRRDFKEWKRKNENILDKIADDLNYILNKFNLELTKIDENQDSFSALTIMDLSNSRVLDYDDLSTGTKNIVSTFIPLKTFSPKDSIILIDEPENSFYPDIQRQLVELYMGVGENNQLIVATHSPLIASSFEPWEVVELKFNENNKIYREKYYEGENRVENYTIDPRMLTWTGILTYVFDLNEDSNFTYREKKLIEYATLKAEIKSIQDRKEKEKKFKELQKLSKKLGLYNQ